MTGMERQMTFAGSLERRGSLGTTAGYPFPGDGEDEAAMTGALLFEPGARAGDQLRVIERSSFNPFKGAFKAVNPARPVSPTNSRLFGPPCRRKRLGAQVIGRSRFGKTGGGAEERCFE